MILTFGELMLRLAPAAGGLRLRQAVPGALGATFAGAEANVAVGLAMLGEPARFVTALPADHPVADCAVAALAGCGVDVSQVVRTPRGRLGVYFYEPGANQLSSKVVYDREHSAAATAGPGDYPWDAILAGATWVHVTGITSAVSEPGHLSNLELVTRARRAGCAVSFDPNFRATLWRWESGTDAKALARRCVAEVLPHVDVLITNHDQTADVMGIPVAPGADSDDPGPALLAQARAVARRFPNVRQVAMTLRRSVSATHNDVGAALYDRAADALSLAPTDGHGRYRPHEVRHIVDRLGAGDAFAAGLIHALRHPALRAPATAVAFAAAAGCLKHSVPGDFNVVTRDEVMALMGGETSGRVRR